MNHLTLQEKKSDELERKINDRLCSIYIKNNKKKFFTGIVDGIESLVQAGVEAIIQPSGSIRDNEIINFANKTNTILVFSKTRHFKH